MVSSAHRDFRSSDVRLSSAFLASGCDLRQRNIVRSIRRRTWSRCNT